VRTCNNLVERHPFALPKGHFDVSDVAAVRASNEGLDRRGPDVDEPQLFLSLEGLLTISGKRRNSVKFTGEQRIFTGEVAYFTGEERRLSAVCRDAA
jgi:hypothetical protein